MNPVQRVMAFVKGAGGSLILPAIAAIILLGEIFGDSGGCIEVKPGEVAVIYNNTGVPVFGAPSRTVIDQGVQTFIPGFQSLQKLERKPQILAMADPENRQKARSSGRYKSVTDGGGDNIDFVRGLTVRAKDGSNFYFDVLEIHYQVKPQNAQQAIEMLGAGNKNHKKLVATYSRGVLRDEFGRFSFLEIADPTTYGEATSHARNILNEYLERYGVEVIQIVTPKPTFDARVEQAIEERQTTEQEIEVQAEKRRKLEQESGLKVQAVEQMKNAEYQTLLAELEAKRKAAENNLISTKRGADKYYIERQASGNAHRDEKVVRAKANTVAYRKEAEGLAAKISAVGAQGPAVLNAVIAKHVFPQLKRIKASPVIPPSTSVNLRYLDPSKKGGN